MKEADWKKSLDSDYDRKIQRFAEEGATGTVGLNFSEGKILSVDLKEHLRAGKKVAGTE